MGVVGCLTISCAATGLSVELKFKDKTAVEGQLLRHTGPRRHTLAQVSGFWSGQIHVRISSKHSHEPAQEGKPRLLQNCKVMQRNAMPQWCVTSITLSRLHRHCMSITEKRNKRMQRPAPTQHMHCIGLLFDCEECGGAVVGRINLREAEPMQMAGLWSCIYDAMHCNQEISSILSPAANSKVAYLIAVAVAVPESEF